MARQLSEFKNILVIHFGQLGDVVLGVPAMRAIRNHFPEAKITVASGRSTAEVIHLANVSDERIAVDRVALRDGKRLKSITEIFRIVADIRKRKFDFVIDLNSLYETNLLGFLSGAKYRLYANRENRSLDFLSNYPIRPMIEDKLMHHTDRYLAAIEPLGLINVERSVIIEPTESGIVDAADLIKKYGVEGKKLIGFFLGAGHPTRRWDLEKFADVARRLSKKTDHRVLVFLGPEESDLRNDVGNIFCDEATIVEELPLGTFIAMLARLDVLVSGDTGPMHLGAAVGTGIVLLSEIGSPKIFRPVIHRLQVLDACPLHEVKPEEVENAVLELLN